MKYRRHILTDWEFRLIRIIWDRKTAAANDVVESLSQAGINRSNSAIRKTLRVMEEKGYITHVDKNGTYYYHALIKKEQVEKNVIQYLRDLFFDGSASAMVMRMVKENQITPELIEEMRAKLKEQKK